jgi:hypothetical protein
MKRSRTGFRFLGFVALADTLFAVSAGLLLLNPIRFDPRPATTTSAPKPPPPPVQAILAEIEQVEQRLDKLEASAPAVQRRASEVLGDE